MTEMLVRDRIAQLYAEAAHDRLVRTASGPRTRQGAGAGAWWRRLMGLPVLTSGVGRSPYRGAVA